MEKEEVQDFKSAGTDVWIGPPAWKKTSAPLGPRDPGSGFWSVLLLQQDGCWMGWISCSLAGHLSQCFYPSRDPAPPPTLTSFMVRRHLCELGTAKSGNGGRERHMGITQRTVVPHDKGSLFHLLWIRRKPWLKSLLPQSC